MSRLHLFKFNKPIKEFPLEVGQEYIAGRGENCDLVLEADRGISRQHIKIYHDGSDWAVEVLSRFGELYQGQNKVSKIILASGDRFEIPPYEFKFEASVVVPPENLANSRELAQVEISDFSDKTFVGQLEVTPYLTVTDHNGELAQIFRLEGHQWVAGRDTSCSVFLDNSKFSRRHFEIRLQEGSYVIQDLGSSNGTLLNGELISTAGETVLHSGDIISVADWSLCFELRDSGFDSRLQEVPVEIRSPVLYQPQMPVESFNSGSQTGPMYNDVENQFVPKKKFNFVRVLIGLILVFCGYYFTIGGGNLEGTPPPQVKSGQLSPFEKLSVQQRQYVKDTYRLADRLFKEGRYELSRQEIAKIHQLIPFYEESQNLEKLADVAIQTQIEQQRADAREKDKIEMEEKISRTVAQCRARVNSNIEMKTVDDCLAPIIAFNPDHPDIVALKSRVDQIILDRVMKNEARADYQARVRRHKALFARAKKTDKSGLEKEAIQAFQVVVNSNLPDPEDLRGKSKREIASIQQKLINQQSDLERVADEAQKKGDLKTAVQTLHKALLVNPENEVIKGRINNILSELKKRMQTYYQEGILEESVGEVETAKTKWKKIMELSLPEEDYYKKAKSKLKKYGVE